ncbi:hypothetical protein [Streptococcus dysgalactiae]|uniref:hypothetical protein n=1 Tax=Streptococcus dysgalactiae TaxID=1334 RepID=UPI003DA13CE4
MGTKNRKLKIEGEIIVFKRERSRYSIRKNKCYGACSVFLGLTILTLAMAGRNVKADSAVSVEGEPAASTLVAPEGTAQHLPTETSAGYSLESDEEGLETNTEIAPASLEAQGATPRAIQKLGTENYLNYAISNQWRLSDSINDPEVSFEHKTSGSSLAFSKATTSIVLLNGKKIDVIASIAPIEGGSQGTSYLVEGDNQSTYAATSDMFAGKPDPKVIPALGIFVQPSFNERIGKDNTTEKLNFEGKQPTAILNIKFSEEVTNPILDFSGLGGHAEIVYESYQKDTYSTGYYINEKNIIEGYIRGSFNSTYLELLNNDLSLNKVGTGVNLKIGEKSIDVEEKNTAHISTLLENYKYDTLKGDYSQKQYKTPNYVPAGAGSVLIEGTFREVSFKLYHQVTPFSKFNDSKYELDSSSHLVNSSIKADGINGFNKFWKDDFFIANEKVGEEIGNDDLFRLSVRLENNLETKGSFQDHHEYYVKYINYDGTETQKERLLELSKDGLKQEGISDKDTFSTYKIINPIENNKAYKFIKIKEFKNISEEDQMYIQAQRGEVVTEPFEADKLKELTYEYEREVKLGAFQEHHIYITVDEQGKVIGEPKISHGMVTNGLSTEKYLTQAKEDDLEYKFEQVLVPTNEKMRELYLTDFHTILTVVIKVELLIRTA